MQHIRNFCIIAHIDHGKSTLADRFIQVCGGLTEREMKSQVLDSMDLERERGITIKAQCVRLSYTALDGTEYQLNLIDTPGHVDFSYEVSRSLVACEGALLVVDAAQGVEAQSVATCFVAIEQDVEVIPVLNKIDLPQADPEACCAQVEDMIGIPTENAAQISAKQGIGISELLERVIKEVPPPTGDTEAPLKALIIDSWFDNYLGVVSLIRVVDGKIDVADKILMMSSGRTHIVDKLGVFTPKRSELQSLNTGEVGYLIAGIKNVTGARVGDTITLFKDQAKTPLEGFTKTEPKVYSGIFPIVSDDYESLRDAMSKLCLNDASIHYEPENSVALGFGFRCGFLGLLHMEIVKERLEREYKLDLIISAPTVVFEIELKDGSIIKVDNPSKLPDPAGISEVREPIVEASIYSPQEYVGAVIALCQDRRGIQKNISYMKNQVAINYYLPMNEVVLDFFDRLKSLTKGYASLDYHFVYFQPADLVKLDILIAGERVDALALIVHRDSAYKKGKDLVDQLKEIIPRQMFLVAIQATIGGNVIARSSVKPLRKNVTAKCYGGDVSRKRKLLEKQKAGKKRMKNIGKVEIPQEAFLAILKIDKD